MKLWWQPDVGDQCIYIHVCIRYCPRGISQVTPSCLVRGARAFLPGNVLGVLAPQLRKLDAHRRRLNNQWNRGMHHNGTTKCRQALVLCECMPPKTCPGVRRGAEKLYTA